MGGGLGGFSKTPMETAIRKMVVEAVKFIVAQTPQSFYHYSADGQPIGGNRPAKSKVSKPGTSVAKSTKPPVEDPDEEEMEAPEAPKDEMGTPKGRKTIQSIKSDVDPNLVAHLNEVKRRGAVLSVVVTLTLTGNKKETEYFAVNKNLSHVMDYDTAEEYEIVKLDGFTSGRLKPGDLKTFQATFKAPKDAKTVGITFSGLGTFDDVEMK
jgi:hypothetical protein